jgi:hypothetical protein
VDYDAPTATLFKEVRVLAGLGLHVPFFFQLSAQERKARYPFAMRLLACVGALDRAWRDAGPDDGAWVGRLARGQTGTDNNPRPGPLCVHWFAEAQSLVEACFRRVGAHRAHTR